MQNQEAKSRRNCLCSIVAVLIAEKLVEDGLPNAPLYRKQKKTGDTEISYFATSGYYDATNASMLTENSRHLEESPIWYPSFISRESWSNAVEMFRYVHCGPMETGLLLTAVMYIAEKLRIMNMDGLTPRDFCENICFGNYGKYSKETPYQFARRKGVSREQAKKINIDYAGNETLMCASNEYIKADIDILRPDYIILPASMYKAAKSFIDQIKGTAVIIPIQQMLAGNVHNHIAPNGRNHRDYRKYQAEELHPAVREAYNGITTVAMNKYLYVFGYLDEVLNSLTDT